MKNLSLDTITIAARDSFAGLPDARQRQLVQALVGHAHQFAREVQLSHAEWRSAISFLHRLGDISDTNRSEFSLLSDVTGISSLVDLLASDPVATPGSVLGPFHAVGSPWKDNPVNLVENNPGQQVVLSGRVCDLGGAPITDATVDFWQNAANGLYWQQDPEQPQDNLRCNVKVDEQGRFEIATVRPVPYQIPTDGPVWKDLVQPAGRGSWRPAHFHLIVSAPGYKQLVTELFEETDPYLESDAVFGVRGPLVGHYQPVKQATRDRFGLVAPDCLEMAFELKLASLPKLAAAVQNAT